MTNEERDFWLRVQERAAQLEPNVARALMKSLDLLRTNYSASEIQRAIEQAGHGPIDQRLFPETLIERAFIPYRDAITAALKRGTLYGATELPDGGKVDGTAAVGFNVLDPKVTEALSIIDDKAINTLAEGIRETVKERVQQGLENGENPKTIARDLRDVIGLAPNQADAIENFRSTLEAGDRHALDYELRDKRFDATLEKTLGRDATEELSPEKIDKMVDAYAKAMLSFNAETNARTITLDAMKSGQRLAVDDAVKHGIYDPAYLFKRWRGTLDDREREEHLAMEGQTVPYDEPFSNGEDIPGESTYNCRCVAVYFEARPDTADSVDDTGSATQTGDQGGEEVGPVLAKGAENDELEKQGLASDSPERRAARRRERARLRKEREAGTDVTTRPGPIEIQPITPQYDPNFTQTAKDFRTTTVGRQTWAKLTREDQVLLAKSQVGYAENIATPNAYGAFYFTPGQMIDQKVLSAKLASDESRTFITVGNDKEMMSWFKGIKGAELKTAQDAADQVRVDVALHETGHALDFAIGKTALESEGLPIDLVKDYSAFLSASKTAEGVTWRALVSEEQAAARTYIAETKPLGLKEAQTPGGEALRKARIARIDMTQWDSLVRTGYGVGASESVETNQVYGLELAADLWAALRDASKIRRSIPSESLRIVFPKTLAYMEELERKYTAHLLGGG